MQCWRETPSLPAFNQMAEHEDRQCLVAGSSSCCNYPLIICCFLPPTPHPKLLQWLMLSNSQKRAAFSVSGKQDCWRSPDSQRLEVPCSSVGRRCFNEGETKGEPLKEKQTVKIRKKAKSKEGSGNIPRLSSSLQGFPCADSRLPVLCSTTAQDVQAQAYRMAKLPLFFLGRLLRL